VRAFAKGLMKPGGFWMRGGNKQNAHANSHEVLSEQLRIVTLAHASVCGQHSTVTRVPGSALPMRAEKS
jgi:hypothetical protein